MKTEQTDELMRSFMHPTVFTGVKPLFIVAEELATKEHMGDVVDAVWVHWEDDQGKEFSYITKFAVQGKILDRNYYTPEEMAPFKGRLALPKASNFEKLAAYNDLKKQIEEVKAKRHALAQYVQKEFDALEKIVSEGQEVCFFKEANGDWVDPFFEIRIEAPYVLSPREDEDLKEGEYRLKHPQTGASKKYIVKQAFHAYIIASRSEVAGLQLKDESYKQKILHLKAQAREVLASLEWLNLDDARVKSIKEALPRHPFESYFKYVSKGEERQLDAPQKLVRAIEIIVKEHMSTLAGPMGVKYIPIDNLLYLFHEIVPRPDALRALEVCDVIHEPSALILGLNGKREVPPKFLVSIDHVAYAYQHFPAFIEACERYLAKEN